jgi:type IV secretion/conjugal transfer VirB4 family ATPase
MLDLREYRTRRRELADYLPWAGLVAPGVVLNKDGALQRTARFRGPDLDASTPAELIAISARVNNALKRLGAGWALFVEAARREAPGYPRSRFPDPVSWLVDEERRAGFEREGAHFEGEHFLTFCYLAPPERAERASKILYDTAGERRGVDWREVLDAFRAETDRVLDLLAALMSECAWLDDAETLAYLHGTVSTHGRHPVAVPEAPFHLDGLLPDCDLTPGVAPMLGRCHLRTLTLRGMPSPTWPGLLDELNRLPIAHRWVARWLPLEKAEAQKEIARKRRHWWAKRKGIAALLREVVWQQETWLVDSDAENQSLDADAALQELGSDAVSFGHFTATVTVWDHDEALVEEKVKLVGRAARAQGFVAVEETLNAVEAWLSSLPGQCYANVRQPLVSSLNLVHMLPLSAVWAGPERNAHLDGPPLLVARTAGSTPFRLVLHQGDVGHTLVVGPTGAGKSVLLALIALQFRRYKGSRVVLFDKGRSSKAAVLGMGGAFHDLHLGDEGGGEAVAFQPLARVDDAAERAWAAEWLATLLVQEGVEVTPEIRGAVWSALGSLASAPRPERTLSGYTALLQSNRLKVALEPYTLAGPYGRLLDAERETVRDADVLAFETEELLGSKRAARAVLTYLFHRIEVRLDGRSTLIPVDEAWFALDDPVFAPKLREWLKTLRRKNASVLFSTQSLADVTLSPIAPAVIESCLSRIFLPNARAVEPESRGAYERLGLNARQVETVARAAPKREYWFQSAAGCRLFELGLGEVALAFCGASRAEDLKAIDRLVTEHGAGGFAPAWLRERGLAWAAELVVQRAAPHPSPEEVA